MIQELSLIKNNRSSMEVGIKSAGRQDFYAKHLDIAPPKGLP